MTLNEQYRQSLALHFEEELADLILQHPVTELASGAPLCAKTLGEQGIPLVLKGRIDAFREDRNGRIVPVYSINPMQTCTLTLNSVLRRHDNENLSVVVPEQTHVVVVPAERSREWMARYDSWRDFVLRMYELRLNDLLREQEIVQTQNENLHKQQREITDSIQYALRIQQAIMPPPEQMASLLPEHFVLYIPRDIVSGDYYWVSKSQGKTVVAVADCTGHGVPGAFMSMLGMAYLGEIVGRQGFETAGTILEALRAKIKAALRQTGRGIEEAQDGMDIALALLDEQTLELQFAGAFNPLYLVRDGELIEKKATRAPVGIYLREKPFENHRFQLRPKDTLYLFSDGFADQFGGQEGDKYKSKRFRELLLRIHGLPMAEQHDALQREFLDWKGQQHAQVDDVVVMGLRIA